MPAILDRPPEAPATTETQAEPTRPWWRRRMPFALPRTRNAAPTDGDELVIDNQTNEAWRVHLGYRDLGVLAAHTQVQVHVVKSGMLTARQVAGPAGAGYLTTYINPSVHTVQIRHSLINNEPFYDLRLLESQLNAAQQQS